MTESSRSRSHDYPALCRSLASWLLGQSQGEHRELKRDEIADRLLEMAAVLTQPNTLPASTLKVLRRAERAVAAYGHAEYLRQDIAALIDAHLTWSESERCSQMHPREGYA